MNTEKPINACKKSKMIWQVVNRWWKMSTVLFEKKNKIKHFIQTIQQIAKKTYFKVLKVTCNSILSQYLKPTSKLVLLWAILDIKKSKIKIKFVSFINSFHIYYFFTYSHHCYNILVNLLLFITLHLLIIKLVIVVCSFCLFINKARHIISQILQIEKRILKCSFLMISFRKSLLTKHCN